MKLAFILYMYSIYLIWCACYIVILYSIDGFYNCDVKVGIRARLSQVNPYWKLRCQMRGPFLHTKLFAVWTQDEMKQEHVQ